MSEQDIVDTDGSDEPVAKKQRIHYGSLEEIERQRLKRLEEIGVTIPPEIQAGIDAGNIHISNS